MFTNKWGSYVYTVYLEDWEICTRVFDEGSRTCYLKRHLPCNGTIYYRRKHGEPRYYCKTCGTPMPTYILETIAGIEQACIERLPYV